MKLVLYDEETLEVKSIVEEVNNPVVDDNSVTWEDGSLSGIKLPFLLLEDDVEILSESIDEILFAQDKKTEHQHVDLIEENKKLKEENKMNALAIMELAQVVMKGGV